MKGSSLTHDIPPYTHHLTQVQPVPGDEPQAQLVELPGVQLAVGTEQGFSVQPGAIREIAGGGKTTHHTE